MKTLLIYHKIDLDGWMSAAIVQYALEIKYGNNLIIHDYQNENDDNYKFLLNDNNHNYLIMLGWDYDIKDLPTNLLIFDQVIVVDGSLPKDLTQQLANYYLNDFIWIDHHKSAIENLTDVRFYQPNLPEPQVINGIYRTFKAACEYTWEFFFTSDKMPEIVNYLGLYDSYRFPNVICKNKPDNFILNYQYGARYYIKNYSDAYIFLKKYLSEDENYINSLNDNIYNKGNIIYDYLKGEAEKILDRGNNAIIRYHDGVKNHEYNFLSVNAYNFNPKNFNVNYDENLYDGVISFYYTGDNYWRFTLMSNTIDVSRIAKTFGGGGHKARAGFKLDNTQFLGWLMSNSK